MAKYIKSHSNYVLKSKHQDINGGTIYERDITTIGGVSDFPNGQTPIYRSNNFIISVRDNGLPSNQYNTEKWEENESGTVWTLESLSGLTSSTVENDDTKIVLKQDYYDLRDFAYYGSLTELFRASVTDIVDRFPGELYVTEDNVYITSAETIGGERYEEQEILGNDDLYLVSNPFGINIHSKVKPIEANPLKYFTDGGFSNYELNGVAISNWSVTQHHYYDEGKERPPHKGESAFTITINDIEIYAYVGDNCDIVYLSSNSGIHIRPNRKFLDNFFNECDNFEKLLMNEDTNYKAVFSVIRENEYGYYREFVPFQFPTSKGGYNIDVTEYGFNVYTKQMVEIGEYYDENFSDNLWRSMTHEAIKNFDWTYTREYQEGDEEEYVIGGRKIQKALRIFAREFDETLSYINNIKNGNRITYDERSNVPDYFLTDVVENSGWNVKLIYPYELTEKFVDDGSIVLDENYHSGNCENRQGQLFNNEDGRPFVREFSQNSNTIVNPYSSDTSGYFNTCASGEVDASESIFSGQTTWFDPDALGGNGALKNVIKIYNDDSDWTYQECNNEFLRRLKINSPYIWRSKGTIDGIEMILGMFGMKSQRWCEAMSSETNSFSGEPDFEISEYTSFAHRIEDVWDAVHQDYRINWINSTKTITYDNRTISNYNPYGIDNKITPYQGLLVGYRDEYTSADEPYIKVDSLDNMISTGVTPCGSGEAFTRSDGTKVLRRYLYPSFNKDEQLDGNPYYQMNGGWLGKKIVNSENDKWNFQFDVDDNIVATSYSEVGENEFLFKETVRNIQRVDNVLSLLALPTANLYDGVICNVTRVEDNAAVIDGVVYPIESEWYNGNKTEYISLVKNNGFIKVGNNKFFDTTIITYDSNGNETVVTLEDKADGYELKAYVINGTFICKEDYDGNYTITSFQTLDYGSGYTNYFKLDDVNYAEEIARFDIETSGWTSGWRRLTYNDNDYIRLNTIINDNKGNNPHNGNMSYDNGHEYFTYFKKLFKYAADNELFDSRCYEDFYQTLDEEINNPRYGFSGLIDSGESVTQYDDFLIEDEKIHYFGNYKTSGSSGIDSIYIYGDDPSRVSGFNELYSTTVINYNLSADTEWIEDYNPYSGQTSGGTIDEVTNQIVNNKRFKIKFNLHNQWYTRVGQSEMKYIDDIVMNYLTQMIPSSAILEIEYVSKNN